ncbi:hypothetical protein ACJIZ3_018762 [Penstemon smallii]|uniref:Uncharacterized protein n=1 Tax=Penstemon smallii TaxID=265156 RepID=A0ABD3T057_9LAMI
MFRLSSPTSSSVVSLAIKLDVAIGKARLLWNPSRLKHVVHRNRRHCTISLFYSLLLFF